MAKDNLEIRLLLRDEVSKALKRVEGKTQKSTKVMKKSFVDLAAKVYVFQQAIMVTGRAIGTFINAAAQMESLGVRLKVVLGSMEEADALLNDVRATASRVPQTFEEISQSAATLASVMKKGREEVMDYLPIIADLSAATGISIQDTTSQIIRMYSAGAASADMFRERGVLAMLGFQAGVSYSAEETMERVIEAWEESGSKFRGATDEMAETWAGQVSMMEDAWFNLRVAVGELITDMDGTNTILYGITTSLNFLAEKVKETFSPEPIEVLRDRLEEINGQIELQQALLGRNLFGDREGQIERINELLDLRSQLILGIIDQQEMLKEQSIELDEIEVVSAEKKLSQWEQLRKTFMETYKTKKTEALKAETYIQTLAGKTAKVVAQAEKDKLGSFMSTMQTAAGINKDFARVYQGILIGEAIMSTAAGVTRALKDYPYPINIAIGALVGAAGAAQIATIASQGFAEGTDSVPAMLTPGEMVIPRSFSDAIRNGDLALSGGEGGVGGGQIVNIEINNPTLTNTEQIDDLVEEISRRIEFEAERI